MSVPGFWPPNDGCIGKKTMLQVKIGDTLDRIGHEYGFYFGRPVNSFSKRSMATVKPTCRNAYQQIMNKKEIAYTQYRVRKPFMVQTCTAAPAFGFPGGAIQYQTVQGSIEEQSDAPNVKKLVDLGYIEPITIPSILYPNFNKNATRNHYKI